LIFGVSTILLAVIVSVLVGEVSRGQLEQQIGDSLSEVAFQMTDKLDRGMFERYRELSVLAQIPLLRNANATHDDQRALLDALQRSYPDYAWIGITDVQGNVIASTGGLLEGQDVSQRPWYVNGRQALFVGDVHEAVLLASLLPNNTGEPLRFVDVATPLHDRDGNFYGVLGAHLSWQWAAEVQQSRLEPLQNEENIEMFVTDHNGMILLKPPGVTVSDQALDISRFSSPAGENGYQTAAWFDGKTYLTGFAHSTGYRYYPGLGWVVLTRQDVNEAFAPVRSLQQTILGIGIVIGVIFTFIGWGLAGVITAPVEAIARAADRIRHGDWSARMPKVAGNDEIAELATSLDNMVSDLQSQQVALKSLNEDLENRVEERTADLQQRNAELDKFAHTVAHDLKNPLNVLNGYVYILQEFYTKDLGAKAQECVQSIGYGAQQMVSITDELLLLARLHKGDAPIEPVDMAPVVANAMRRLTYLVDEFQATMVIPDTWPTAMGYAPWIAEVWANYISNAIKYGGRPPRVELGATVQPDGVTRFWVRDNGAGLTEEQRNQLFTVFTRLNQVNTTGHGLGLSIVRQIVEKLGGTVGIDSTLGEGSVFYFTLPTALETTNEAALQAENA
jgi:signal transduction histidine kinase